MVGKADSAPRGRGAAAPQANGFLVFLLPTVLVAFGTEFWELPWRTRYPRSGLQARAPFGVDTQSARANCLTKHTRAQPDGALRGGVVRATEENQDALHHRAGGPGATGCQKGFLTNCIMSRQYKLGFMRRQFFVVWVRGTRLVRLAAGP